MAEKLDIFEVLQKIDDFDLAFFKSLTDEQKKGLAPFVLLQWLSGCKSKEQILRINSFLNYYVFNLGQHPDLLYYLAMISSNGKRSKYNWVKKKNKNKKYSTTVKLLRKYYDCSSSTALEYISLLNYDDVEEIAFELGEQEDTLKKIKKEMA